MNHLHWMIFCFGREFYGECEFESDSIASLEARGITVDEQDMFGPQALDVSVHLVDKPLTKMMTRSRAEATQCTTKSTVA